MNLKFQNLNPNELKSPKRINRSLCNEEIDFYRFLNKKSKKTLVNHLLEFWENNQPLSKREFIPSLKVLKIFEKCNNEQLDYVNKYLKDPSSPLKVVSSNLKKRIRINHASIKNNKLFRAPVVLPASVLPGEYKVKILHLRDGLKISEENTNIFVRKTGFEARIYSFAHNYSAFYGVFAIILAILAGYLAALSFRKI